jgi:hypothetical protein
MLCGFPPILFCAPVRFDISNGRMEGGEFRDAGDSYSRGKDEKTQASYCPHVKSDYGDLAPTIAADGAWKVCFPVKPLYAWEIPDERKYGCSGVAEAWV